MEESLEESAERLQEATGKMEGTTFLEAVGKDLGAVGEYVVNFAIPGSDLDVDIGMDFLTGRSSRGKELDFEGRIVRPGSYIIAKSAILAAEAFLVYKAAEFAQESGLYDIFYSNFLPHF